MVKSLDNEQKNEFDQSQKKVPIAIAAISEEKVLKNGCKNRLYWQMKEGSVFFVKPSFFPYKRKRGPRKRATRFQIFYQAIAMPPFWEAFLRSKSLR